jgi:serine protease inhibitor
MNFSQFLFFILIGGIATVFAQADSCADQNNSCPSWLELCSWPGYQNFMNENCKKTCGLCKDQSQMISNNISNNSTMDQTGNSANCMGSVSDDELQRLSNDLAQFAFHFYGEASKAKNGENLFFSPFSISIAFAMLTEGAKGNSAKELYNALVPTMGSSANLRALFGNAVQTINRKNKPFQLDTANAAYVEQSYKVQSFKHMLNSRMR